MNDINETKEVLVVNEDELVEINEDELVGYIMRRAKDEHDINLFYSDVRAILDLELEFLESKDVAKKEQIIVADEETNELLAVIAGDEIIKKDGVKVIVNS